MTWRTASHLEVQKGFIHSTHPRGLMFFFSHSWQRCGWQCGCWRERNTMSKITKVWCSAELKIGLCQDSPISIDEGKHIRNWTSQVTSSKYLTQWQLVSMGPASAAGSHQEKWGINSLSSCQVVHFCQFKLRYCVLIRSFFRVTFWIVKSFSRRTSASTSLLAVYLNLPGVSSCNKAYPNSYLFLLSWVIGQEHIMHYLFSIQVLHTSSATRTLFRN